ncbi:MAG TPA: iron-sulfur cluster carrier protein ApbC [Thermomicrobiales bacterium]|nr:iron-sulfur cluster carrier protein ApbC [Thermomicrobiales bacterium]
MLHIQRESWEMTDGPNGRPANGGELTRERVLDAIRDVQEPEIGRSLVDLRMIPDVAIDGRDVALTVELLRPAPPYKDRLDAELRAALATLPAVGAVAINWTTRVRASGGGKADAQAISGVKNTIAVASGKGGVGKSTVAANLAVALAQAGASVGLLDTDVYGPSIPLMMGQSSKPLVRDGKIVPLEAHGVKVMSIGFLLDPEKALIWRGPLVAQLINQFLNDVIWGELDYLILDLPPGTGDVQLTLVQKIPISGAVIVTTPQEVALADAVKGMRMFQEVKTTVLGIVENMSWFTCPHCGERTPIFGEGGGERVAKQYDVPLLGQIPIEPAVRAGGDAGVPIVVGAPESESARAFAHLAERVAARLAADAVAKPRKPMIRLLPTR